MRVQAKSTTNGYVNYGWDLVDANRADSSFIYKLDLKTLPDSLKNKSREADNKTQEIERLKKEKSEVEIRLNKSLTEWKEKYSKQGKLLDTEQLEGKRLEGELEKLEKKITELEKERKELLKNQK